MTQNKKSFYVTTPIYYVNAKPHLGHIYTTLVADTYTRFKRQRGYDAFFLTGTDERGVNIERAAAASGVPVQQFVDQIVGEFKEAFKAFDLQYSRWIRTTDAHHKTGVQNLWRLLDQRGFIYKGKYQGWFCPYCNEYKDVEDNSETPLCPTHERPLEVLAEESYFFKLSAFEKPLLELYRSRPDFVQPVARLNEVVSFVSSGLKDLSISRVSVKWGIPVPGDEQHTIYVWFDALANYITALGWGNDVYKDFDRYWPALHLIGKDIIRFHAVFWPAFLMAAGVEVPRTVYAHGMWLSGGRKMSKTLGNVIDLQILRQFFSPDQVRYFCLREMAFGQDGDFTYEGLIDRINADLAGGLGNLSSRTLTMVRDFCGGIIPIRPTSADADLIKQTAEVEAAIRRVADDFAREFDAYNPSRALDTVWAAMGRVDKFISDAQPWDLAKKPDSKSDLHLVLFTTCEALRHLAVILSPVLPAGTQSIWHQLGEQGKVSEFNPSRLEWGEERRERRIDEVKPIFPRMDKKSIMEEIKQSEQTGAGTPEPKLKEEQAPAANATVPEQPQISIEDFAKVEMRVGTIQTAERIPKADKLLKLTIDIGDEVRQVLAGIALHYEPESLIGKKVVVVTNLEPRKMRGLESNGMIVAASVGSEGRPVLATFTEEVPNGARLK